MTVLQNVTHLHSPERIVTLYHLQKCNKTLAVGVDLNDLTNELFFHCHICSLCLKLCARLKWMQMTYKISVTVTFF